MIFCITVRLAVLSFLLYTTVTVNTKNENKIEFNFPSDTFAIKNRQIKICIHTDGPQRLYESTKCRTSRPHRLHDEAEYDEVVAEQCPKLIDQRRQQLADFFSLSS